MIGENEHLFEYLQGEVACMKEIDYKHIVELHEFVEDEDYFYMVLEYCNGGDLMNLQATQPNKVFSLERATQYLSQVILGLEVLHKRGYLHRDIKPQNVLVKTINNEKVHMVLGRSSKSLILASLRRPKMWRGQSWEQSSTWHLRYTSKEWSSSKKMEKSTVMRWTCGPSESSCSTC